jgi:C1A family cysteine protease
MKKTTFRLLSGGVFAAVLLFGCSKSNENSSTASKQAAVPEFTLSNGQHYYGCILRSPDEAAEIAAMPRYHESNAKLIAGLPASYSIAHPPVGDQGQQGSCTGWGGANTDGIYYYYKAGLTSWSQSTDIMSASFIYNKIKMGGCDAGSTVLKVVKYLKSTGDCIYNDMTYTDASCSATPSSAATTNGALHKITSYSSIAPTDIATIKAALAANHPVIIGIEVDNAFENLTSSKYTWTTNSTAILGGHCNTLYGYDDTKGVFLALNQWGTSWGNAGVYYITYTLFQATGNKARIDQAYSVQ